MLLAMSAGGSPAFASGSPSLAAPSWCPVKAAGPAMAQTAAFRRIAEKAARRETITLVAIGSSSTEGSDLSDPTLAYPTHLERHLNALLGGQVVTVLNKGKGGEGVPETVARFKRDVVSLKPDLVVWQLGSNDIVRRADPAVTAKSVEDGMLELAMSGTPIVMMDTQTAPAVAASPVLEQTQTLLKSAAVRHHALFWSRFELMRGILASRAAGADDLIKPDQLHMTVPMHVCTGKVLAEAIAVELGQISAEVISASR
jgi:lysophospholipase L1-like esterase